MCLSQIIKLYVLQRAVCQLNLSKTRTNFYKNTLVGETWSPPCHCVGGILGCEQERGLIPSGVERTGGGGHSQQEHCQAPEVGEAGGEGRVDSLRPLGNQGGDLSRAACV